MITNQSRSWYKLVQEFAWAGRGLGDMIEKDGCVASLAENGEPREEVPTDLTLFVVLVWSKGCRQPLSLHHSSKMHPPQGLHSQGYEHPGPWLARTSAAPVIFLLGATLRSWPGVMISSFRVSCCRALLTMMTSVASFKL